jgi:hypothetical protein
MDWPRYRALCDRPDVMSRWLLERTAAVLDAEGAHELARDIRAPLAGDPLPRPPDHRGPADLDMFPVRWPPAIASALAARLDALDARGDLAPALRLPSARGVLAAWREYAAFAASSLVIC